MLAWRTPETFADAFNRLHGMAYVVLKVAISSTKGGLSFVSFFDYLLH